MDGWSGGGRNKRNEVRWWMVKKTERDREREWICVCVCVCVCGKHKRGTEERKWDGNREINRKCVKARAIPCPHLLPTRGDNTVLVAWGSTATPGTTKLLLPLDRVSKKNYIYIYIYIYIYTRSTKIRNYIVHSSSFFSAVCDL